MVTAKLSSNSTARRCTRFFTPARRLIRQFRPPLQPSLIKKHSTHAQKSEMIDSGPTISTPSSLPCISGSSHGLEHTLSCNRPNPRAACVALQNEDTAEDAIVITALDTIPFCCHEDLLAMTRPQLINAALTLNNKLPAVLRIDIGSTRSDGFIRNSIEVLVGIRNGEAPYSSHTNDSRRDISEGSSSLIGPFLRNPPFTPPFTPPCSPRRNYPSDLSTGVTPRTRLECLQEEDEPQAPKRRRVSPETTFPFSPTPCRRPPVFRSTSLQASPTASSLALQPAQRSVSETSPSKLKTLPIDMLHITTTRPRYATGAALLVSQSTASSHVSDSVSTSLSLPAFLPNPYSPAPKHSVFENGLLATSQSIVEGSALTRDGSLSDMDISF
jgi:hypothetical protein